MANFHQNNTPCYASSSSSSSSRRMDSLWSIQSILCLFSFWEDWYISLALIQYPLRIYVIRAISQRPSFPIPRFPSFWWYRRYCCIMMSSGLDCPAYSQLQHQFNQPKPVLLRSSKSTFIFLHHHGLPLPCKEEQQARLLRLPLACFTIIEMFFSIKINRHLFVNNV